MFKSPVKDTRALKDCTLRVSFIKEIQKQGNKKTGKQINKQKQKENKLPKTNKQTKHCFLTVAILLIIGKFLIASYSVLPESFGISLRDLTSETLDNCSL